MHISRRRALALGGAAVVGGAVTRAGQLVGDGLAADTPLPLYGGPESDVHADRSPTSATVTKVAWGGTGTGRRVALTFDDGPDPDWTPRVLAALRRAAAPATFFCVGRKVRDHGPIHADSLGVHELGNHTFEHPDLARFALERCQDEIGRTSDLMERTYGQRPTLFRPPYGHLGGAALLAAAEAELTMVFWSAQAREDMAVADPNGAVDDLARQVRPGSIILAHDTGSPARLRTIDHLDRLIDRLRADGYELVTVSQLLAAV
ncbi:polysaccharide deacetylase family protein [Intrasporangium sp. DVR]|uniref:polysaccharide deacetylase family protein n=1 Tax=Intrasporangium sp. DVR TaxID=3127867 RepID=UPI003342E20E